MVSLKSSDGTKYMITDYFNDGTTDCFLMSTSDKKIMIDIDRDLSPTIQVIIGSLMKDVTAANAARAEKDVVDAKKLADDLTDKLGF
jgi:hypothetical protein